MAKGDARKGWARNGGGGFEILGSFTSRQYYAPRCELSLERATRVIPHLSPFSLKPILFGFLFLSHLIALILSHLRARGIPDAQQRGW